MCSSLMDHNDSPGSTTKESAVVVIVVIVVVVLFCGASMETAPVSWASASSSWAWASSWASAMPGSTARIANAANATSAANATPASTVPTYPLSLLVLKMFPPYSEKERHFPCPKPKAGQHQSPRCPLKKGAPRVRRGSAWEFGYQPGGGNEPEALTPRDRGGVCALEDVEQREDGQKLEAEPHTRGASEGATRGRGAKGELKG